MCGIFGYSGTNEPGEILINGLRRLEYRGYDSWGVSFVLDDSVIYQQKNVGKIPQGETPELAPAVDNYSWATGIAHTRWATHGGVTQINAHPHFSSDNSFTLAQNGIAENYQELKKELLAKGYKFISDTDTEVIVRLIEEEQKTTTDFKSAVISAFSKLTGRNTIIALHQPSKTIVAIRNGSPLVIGKKEESGNTQIFLGSDYLSFANFTNLIMEMDNNTGVVVGHSNVEKFKVLEGGQFEELATDFHSVDVQDEQVDMGNFPDFMSKEINEQPQTILNATSYSAEDLEPLIQAIKSAKTVYTVGCGTAAIAASQIAYYLRKNAGIKVTELKGYEVDSYKELFDNDDLLLAISQSGETADTIEPIEYMKAKNGKIASLVNMIGSSITKLSDYPYYSRTGPEICVASTKAFTAQLSWGFLLSEALIGNYQVAKDEIKKTSEEMAKFFENNQIKETLQAVVEYCMPREHFFVLGRGQNYTIALEAALKIKEISYKHFEGFAAGELKHGVIALIESGVPVFAVVSEDENEADMLNAIAEVKTRGAKVIAVAPKNNELYDFHIPVPNLPHTSAITNVVPFQLISHDLGIALGNDVDKPRNLAKSVTVK